VVRRDQNKVK